MFLAAAMAYAMPAAQAAEEPWHGTDARQQVPNALLGAWKADVAASHYTDPSPRKALRFFAYTEGGKVLVSFMTLNAKGQLSSGHWAAQVMVHQPLNTIVRVGQLRSMSCILPKLMITIITLWSNGTENWK